GSREVAAEASVESPSCGGGRPDTAGAGESAAGSPRRAAPSPRRSHQATTQAASRMGSVSSHGRRTGHLAGGKIMVSRLYGEQAETSRDGGACVHPAYPARMPRHEVEAFRVRCLLPG